MEAKSCRAMAVFMAVTACFLPFLLVSANEIKESTSSSSGIHLKTYTHTWPDMEFGWRIVVGTLMGLCGAAFGSAGGVGGGGVYVPMLVLVIGFDSKSSTAISKCMIMGTAASTVCYNIRPRHPTLEMPLIDYDLALLITPMLLIGISIGVTFNVIFAEWMITALLIMLCLVVSIKAFFNGAETWRKETILNDAARNFAVLEGNAHSECELLSGGSKKDAKVSIIENVEWKKLGIIFSVWVAILALQIIKSYTTTCSAVYWVLSLLQIPVAVAASGYEAVMLYKGKRVIASVTIEDEARTNNFTVRGLVFYCLMGAFAGVVGGMLGVSGGSIMGPLFLGMGVPPQVSSVTATFAVMFSSSMSSVEYYLLKQFPIPYTLYFVGVTAIAAFVGQYIVKRWVEILGRASLIIFVLAFTIFISSILIGVEGIINAIYKIEHHEYMGFDGLCSSSASYSLPTGISTFIVE